MHPHTIDYAVFGAKRVLHDERTEVLLCQLLMNRRFTWRSAGLALYLPFEGHIISSLASDVPLRAAGRTRVGDDDWNAILVLRFLAWVSTRIRGSEVRVRDESGFLRSSDIAFVAGVAHELRAEHEVGAAEPCGATDDPRTTRRLVRMAGRAYDPVPATLYLDVPEIAALPIPREELATMSLDDVMTYLLFPWDTERLGKFVPSS